MRGKSTLLWSIIFCVGFGLEVVLIAERVSKYGWQWIWIPFQ